MDYKDFGRWWRDYGTRFPATSRWVNDLGKEGAQGLLKSWADTLADVPLRDAMAITYQMATDQLAPVGSFDSERERTAVIVRRAAKALASADVVRAKPAAPVLRPNIAAIATDERGQQVTLRDLSARLAKYLASGRSAEEARAEAFRGITWTSDPFDFRRDAFHCLACRDSGTVTIWSPGLHETAIFRPKLILEDPRNRSSCCAPCKCEEGEKRVWKGGGASPPPNWKGWKSRFSQYNADRFCRVEDVFLGDDEAERFVAWAKGYFERCRIARPAGKTDKEAEGQDQAEFVF